MAYTKREYDDLVKMHMPVDDAHVMGQRPAVKGLLNDIVDKVKNIEYMCEEVRAQVEDVKIEVDKI